MKLVNLYSIVLAAFLLKASAVPASNIKGIGQTNRPLKAKCTASTQCLTGYCGYSRCSQKAKVGQYCYKDAGCQEGARCSKNKCVSKVTSGYTLGHSCASSTQCASALCENSKCSNKHANGEECYKNNACISGFCKDSKKCAPAASSTSSFTSAISGSTPIPTATGTLTLKDTTWTDLSAYRVTGTGTLTTLRDSSLCNGEPSCGKVVIPDGGSISITQQLVVSSLRKRDDVGTPNFVTNIPSYVIAFSPEQSPDDYTSPKCDVQYTTNGVAKSHNLANGVSQYGWDTSSGAPSWDNTLTSMGADVICKPGASITILFGKMSFIDIRAYEASESAGNTPTRSIDDNPTATVTVSQTQGTSKITLTA